MLSRSIHCSSRLLAATPRWGQRSNGSSVSSVLGTKHLRQSPDFAHDVFFAQHKPLQPPPSIKPIMESSTSKTRVNLHWSNSDQANDEWASLFAGFKLSPPQLPQEKTSPPPDPTLADFLLKDSTVPAPPPTTEVKTLYLPRRPHGSGIRDATFKRYLRAFDQASQRVIPPPYREDAPKKSRNSVQDYVEQVLYRAKHPSGWKRMTLSQETSKGRRKSKSTLLDAALLQVLKPSDFSTHRPLSVPPSAIQAAESNVLFTMGVPSDDVLHNRNVILDPEQVDEVVQAAKLRVSLITIRRKKMKKHKLKKLRRRNRKST